MTMVMTQNWILGFLEALEEKSMDWVNGGTGSGKTCGILLSRDVSLLTMPKLQDQESELVDV